MTPKIHEPSTYKARITDWPVEERPRERLQQMGSDAVSSAELIAILLGGGTAKYNAVELAKMLLRRFKNLSALSNASLEELQEVPGIGPARAITLQAAFQLYRNLQREQAENELVSFRNAAQVAQIYQPLLGHSRQERFFVVLLNSALQRIGDFEVTRGILDTSLVHPREVFYTAIRELAKGIIVMHNHPSGRTEPSEADKRITDQLVKAGKILGIEVFDHLIITRDSYFSFQEGGLL